jgi:hypothetical protein
MKRSDFPKPFSTGLVDINSQAAYDDIGMPARKYPRYMPSCYTAISEDEHRWYLAPWRKNLKVYPQLFFIIGKDVAARDPKHCKDAVLGIGMGLACSDDGVVKASPDPAIRDTHMCYWYSLYSDDSQVLAQEMKAGLDARKLQLTIESPTLGKYVFDQGKLLFDPDELLASMNILIPYQKYDLVSLGAADKPLYVAAEQKFAPGEVITISCPELGKLEITVDDQRDVNTVMNGWTPRPFFLDPEFR